MASVIAHELEETVTDPDLNGWYGASISEENADSCAGHLAIRIPRRWYGQYPFGARDFLIQRNLIPVGTPSCALELHYSHASGNTGPGVRGDFDGDGIAMSFGETHGPATSRCG